MTAINGNVFSSNGKPYSNHNGDDNPGLSSKIKPTMLAVAFTTIIDVIVFLADSIGFIIQVRFCEKSHVYVESLNSIRNHVFILKSRNFKK